MLTFNYQDLIAHNCSSTTDIFRFRQARSIDHQDSPSFFLVPAAYWRRQSVSLSVAMIERKSKPVHIPRRKYK